MQKIQLLLVFLIVCFNVTFSVDSSSGTYIDIDDLPSFYNDSDSLPEIKVQEIIDDAKAKCVTQREANDIAEFLSSFTNTLVEATISRLNKIDDRAAYAELSDKKRASSQIKELKKKVTETANKANCPAPDDPSLLGEFDSILELVYEMCFVNQAGNADEKRNTVARYMQKLVHRILSSIGFILENPNPSQACLKIIEECKTVLDDVQLVEEKYDLELRSIYSSCANIAYEHAEKFMPSVIERATSCRTMNSKRINPLTWYTGRI